MSSYGRAARRQDMSQAIKRFQKFFHLKVTGKLDIETQNEMLKPRCGDPDEANGAQSFRTFRTKWSKTSLTYRFFEKSQDVSERVMRATFVRAFKFWSDVTPLRFREVRSGSSDITIRYVDVQLENFVTIYAVSRI